ncbi:sugar ABC transporter permease [Mycoplasma phocoenae]|uniref:Sugar ABC transporter permease n=1 Tax=Mycoplasma phocoenae TaxID=754517 RepID=A0A858U496_9MOLU|nr:sugar ABC transporter permease [Mycoplasma phocoenae]
MKSKFYKKFRLKNHLTSLSILNSKTPGYKPFLLLFPSLLTITMFTIIPFILVISDSFKIKTGFVASDFAFGTENYTEVFNHIHFRIGMRNSILYSVVALPISLVFSLLISSAIVHVIRKWSQGFWQTIFFLPYVTSGIAVSVTFFYLFDSQTGMINNFFGISTPWLNSGDTSSWYPFVAILANGVWHNLAFQVLILTGAMLSINKTLYKSASIDGSYKLNQFFSITLPSIKNQLSFLFTVGIIGGIKVFPLALFNNDADSAINNGGSTIMLFLYRAVQHAEFEKAGAASVLLFLIGVLVSFTIKKTVSISYNLSTTLGVKHVSNKITSQTKVSKAFFKL